MTSTRDWEIMPIDKSFGQKFGYDIYPTEFKRITGDVSLVVLSDTELSKLEAEEKARAPLIKKGAFIDAKLITALKAKKCTVIPVLYPEEPKELDKLSAFAVQHTFFLSGRIYSCVEDWLAQIRRDRAISVVQAVKKYRTPLLQSLNNALKDWRNTVTTLVNDILISQENLSILSLFDDYLAGYQKIAEQKQHGVEVALLAIMLGKRCNLTPELLKDLGLAALIHDIGLIFYEHRLREMLVDEGKFLEPYMINDLYDMHPFFGAVLVTKKNGETISGINSRVRDAVLEHEQKIDGSRPAFLNSEFKEELKLLSIDSNTFFHGTNTLKVDPAKPKEVFYPGKDELRRNLSIISQILHISEMYVTSLQQLTKKGVQEPHKYALTRMLTQAGKKINGQIFELFFNYLVPPDYYPDKLVVKLQVRESGADPQILKYNNYNGVIIRSSDQNKQRTVLHLVKTPDGKDFGGKVNFDLNKEKNNLYLKIDEWTD